MLTIGQRAGGAWAPAEFSSVPAWSHVCPLQTGRREEARGRLPRTLLQLAVLPARKRTVTFYGPFSFPMVILILHSMYVPFLGY